MNLKNKKILIVEDEAIIALNLKFILDEYGYNSVDIAMDSDETQSLFTKTLYDLVLMDINLGDHSTIDGIDLIHILSKKYPFLYMYITANADEKTVEKTKGTNPLAYIVKPFIKSSIYANVEIALSKLNDEVTFTFLHKGIQKEVPISHITHVEADGSYITLHTLLGDQYLIRKSLSDFSQLFPTFFSRIHKSILVNKNYIQEYTSQFVKVNNHKLPLGRTYKQSFLEQTDNV